MRVLIEEYRGWEISFDTDSENFYCVSDRYDVDKTRKSFASVKKWIDDFIKENQNFKPFVIESLPKSYGDGILTVIGIRKDGNFMVQTAKGEKKQLSRSDEKRYILRASECDVYRKEANDLQDRINQLRKVQEELLAKVTGVSLVEYRKTLI
jgi:hypothetical protein